MRNKRIEELKSIAEEISLAVKAEEQIPLLSRGFDLFSKETERLSKAYQVLHSQFRKVNEKLEDTNERLSKKVQELHSLTNYLDNILSRMSQGLLFIDSGGYITTYNEAAAEILEKARGEVLYQKFANFFSDDIFGYSMNEALTKKKAPKLTYISLLFTKGKKKEIEVSTTSAHETKQDLIVLLRDITEVKQLQIMASRNDRMTALGEMAAQVAHEIRNPLGGIKGFAALLHRDLYDKPELLRLTEYIVEGANTLDRLVTQVLTFSRPLPLECKNIDLAELLVEFQESLLAEGLPPGISLSLEITSHPNCFVDSGLLKSALHNLVMNGIQAMPEGGKITLRLSSTQTQLEIEVIDTGTGIPQENLEKLFSPFFSTKPDGNGLGLVEVHKVIEAHGGEIIVDSFPEFGTCFTLKIPYRG